MHHFKKLLALSLFLSFTYLRADSQTFNLVKDINQTRVFNDGGFISHFIKVNQLVFFVGWTPETGSELWVSDGTPAGTRMVKDLRPGTNSSHPYKFTRSGNNVYFLANSIDSGLDELWRSDGTELGTFQIKSFQYYNPEGYFGETMVPLNNELFFSYNDSIHGMELWKSNGTEAGTVLVKDIEPGKESSKLTELVAMNGILYFKRISNNLKSGIWRSDGTATGTAEILNQSFFQYQSPFNTNNTILNNFQYYTLQNNNGTAIWKTDGTVLGTTEVKRLSNASAVVQIITVFNNHLFFTVSSSLEGSSLWKTDGTEAGTSKILNIQIDEVMYGNQKSFAVNGNTLFFTATTAQNGVELWKTDGTAIGTVLVKDILPGNGSSQPRNFVTVNGKMGFTANDGIHGIELWISDGTTTGTTLMQDFKPGIESSYPQYDQEDTQQLIFSVDIGNGKTEIWITDATSNGTKLIRDMRLGTANATGIYFNAINVYDQFLLFEANNGIDGFELWKTDGTEAGTFMMPEIFPGKNEIQTYITHFTKLNGKILFRATGPYTKNELWITDGNPAGTQKIKDIMISYTNIVVAGNNAYFGGNANSAGDELWKTDGTEAGTVLVKDINPIPYGQSSPEYLTNVNGTLFFAAMDSIYRNNLWKSDGTEAGTLRVKVINQTQSIDIPGIRENQESEFVNVNGRLFFTADDGLHGMELWKSDGTEAGTVMVKDIFKGPASIITDTMPRFLTNVNGTLFFVAVDSINGESLWKSDGTEAGTIPVKSFGKPWIRNINNLVKVNDVLFFTAKTDANGNELWKSNGTTNGTVMIKDIAPGLHSGFYLPGIVADGHYYFSANDRINGDEIWKSDGTEAGTVMVQNISSKGGCNPQVFAKVGNKLFSVVTTDNYGKEIWVAQSGTTTNVPNMNIISSVSVYPNPANDFATIVFPVLSSNTTWQVYNTHGQLIQTGSLNPGATKLSIDMRSFSKGLYLFKMKTSQSLPIVKKILKQ